MLFLISGSSLYFITTKRVKEDHQRLWEEEAQREAKAKKAWREAEGKEAWREAEEVEKACKEAEGAEKA